MSDIAKQLRKIRREKELSQESLSAIMGLSDGGYVSQWELGRRNPTLSTLHNWADALGYRLTLEPKDEA
jgi:transcriptional regulator with XRE-family HTH domain